MTTEVKVGQVWRDKDKRRNTVIEILSVYETEWIDNDWRALGLVTGTEEEREYDVDRLVKRWELVREAPEPVPTPASKNYQLKAVCAHNDDVKVRLTEKIAQTYGMPLCPCHREAMVFAERRSR